MKTELVNGFSNMEVIGDLIMNGFTRLVDKKAY
jgi:hypothetical protein